MDEYFIALDVGGTKIKALIVDSALHPLAGVRVPSLPGEGMDALMERVVAATDAVIARARGRECYRIKGIGVGFFGLIDREKGEGIYSLRLNMERFPIAQRLAARYEAPVVVDNDAHVAVLGEITAGAARGHRDVVQLNLGTSLAGGVVIDGAVLRGPRNVAGELGHFTVQTAGGEPCFCGRHGCALNYVSGTAIRRQFLVELAREPASVVWSWVQGDSSAVHLAMLDEALDLGDPAAERTLVWALEYLGALVSSLVALFTPSMVVIGGGVSHLGDRLVVPLRSRVEAGLLHPVQRCEIATAELGQESGLIGALMLAVEATEPTLTASLAGIGKRIDAVMDGASV